MHNSWQNYVKIEFHQDFLKRQELRTFINSNLFAKLFSRSNTCRRRLRVVERAVKVIAAQKLLQMLISTRDDDNRKRKFINGIVVNGYVYKWRTSRHIHYQIKQGFLNLIYAILFSKLLNIDYSQPKFNWVRNNLMRARKTQVEI